MPSIPHPRPCAHRLEGLTLQEQEIVVKRASDRPGRPGGDENGDDDAEGGAEGVLKQEPGEPAAPQTDAALMEVKTEIKQEPIAAN